MSFFNVKMHCLGVMRYADDMFSTKLLLCGLTYFELNAKLK